MEFVDLSAIILLSLKTLSAKIFLLTLLEKIKLYPLKISTFSLGQKRCAYYGKTADYECAYYE